MGEPGRDLKRMMLHTEELQCCQEMPRAGEAAGDREPGGLPVGWEGLGHKAAPLLSVPSPWLLATMPAAFRPYFSECICKARG